MRQITSNMIAALRDGRAWKEKATSTHRGERGMLVRLHADLIAVVTADTVELCAAGWPTATTCDRLDAIAREFTGWTVGRYRGDIVCRKDTTKITYPADAWITLPRE